VVYASVTGFGQDGPYARRAGYNTIAQGMSGLMALTGMPGHPPTRVGGSVSDLAAAYVAFGAINAALVHRLRSGRGQYLDVNLLASSIALLPDPVSTYFDSGQRPARVGNRNATLTPAEAYPTKDGFVNVVIMNPDQYDRFCQALEDERLREPRFATNDSRLQHYDEFRATVESVLARATTAEWMERLEKAQIAAGPVYELDQVFEDPQVKHLGVIAEVDQPAFGRVRTPAFPARASATPANSGRPAPLLGEHTAEILDELGLAKDEIARLHAAGIIYIRPKEKT
ncbi:MAG: CoA transferase, partial [Candidatus Rokubacteria bacterium]|nr:CoA transferase [Candidatus Rokubacteria bacterium]